ncbi:MAG: glycosyltransferase [Clostridia bacterium]|nr:glycosyltransferase [Clostridia bacterium]
MWGDTAIAFLLAFITAFVITPYTMRLAKRVGAIDVPNERRINKKPMPRLGGIAVVCGFFVSIIYLSATMMIEGKVDFFGSENYYLKLLGFSIGILVLAMVCYIDDTKSIHPISKLLGQVVAAVIIVLCGVKIDSPWFNNMGSFHIAFSYILTIGWIVGITNAINLIDGLDGLSSGITLISCLSLLIIFSLNGTTIIPIILITALAGGIVGFLPYNFNPAKTYIGDTGSNFLGYSLAVISILGVAKTYTAIVIVAPLIVLGLPIFDTLFAIVRRIIKGKSIKAVLSPDKGHLHHKLMAKGYTQKQAVLILYGVSATLGMFAIILFESGIWKAISFALMVAAIVGIGYDDMFKLHNGGEDEIGRASDAKMKKVTILLLHLQHGGIEKQSITFANELSKKYNVEIISTYTMKTEPAYSINPKVKIKYLIDDKPNRDEFKNAVRSKNLIDIIKQAYKAIKILFLKNHLMIKEIKKLNTDFVISTRIEYANMLSKYAPDSVVKITQEHLHDDSTKYVNAVKKSFKNLDYLIVLAPGSMQNYSKWLVDNKKIKIVEIPNILEEIPKESSLLNGNNIVSVGRLHPVKNFETLIKVFKGVVEAIPNATLTIVGGGEEYEKLDNLANDLNISKNVKITGMLNKEEVKKYLLTSDIFVMTSLTECFPMVLLEASSCGLPLVSFDVPVGPKAIIKNGENGFLIQNRNEDEMTETIIALLKDREKLASTGRKAKEMSFNFVPEKIMGKWDEIFGR